MSGELIEIKARTKTGVVQSFHVAEIIEINGKRYVSQEENEDLRTHLIHLDGRVSALEKIIAGGN